MRREAPAEGDYGLPAVSVCSCLIAAFRCCGLSSFSKPFFASVKEVSPEGLEQPISEGPAAIRKTKGASLRIVIS